jgi:hypothetical protein
MPTPTNSLATAAAEVGLRALALRACRLSSRTKTRRRRRIRRRRRRLQWHLCP